MPFTQVQRYILTYLTRFFKMLGSDEQRAWYGPDHVALAVDRGAVGTLLISDELFRASEPEVRKQYVALVEEVRAKGAEVLIFSGMHESGKREFYHLVAIAHDVDVSRRAQPDHGYCCYPHFPS